MLVDFQRGWSHMTPPHCDVITGPQTGTNLQEGNSWGKGVTSREKGRSHTNVSSPLLALLWLFLLTIIMFLWEDQQRATKLRRQSPKDKRGWRFQPLRKALISSRRRQGGRQASVAQDDLLMAEGAFRRGG